MNKPMTPEELFEEWNKLPVDQILSPSEYREFLADNDIADIWCRVAFLAGFKAAATPRDAEIKELARAVVELNSEIESWMYSRPVSCTIRNKATIKKAKQIVGGEV